MQNKELQKLDFTTMRNLLHDSKPYAYIYKGMGMLRGAKKDFTHMLPQGTPFILEELRIGYIKKGEGDYVVNLAQHDLSAGTLVFLNKGSIIQIGNLSDDFELAGVAIDDYTLLSAFGNRSSIPLVNEYADLFITPGNDELLVVDELLRIVWDIMHQEHRCEAAAGGVVAALLHYFNHIYKFQQQLKPKTVSHSREILNNFVRLVNGHAHQERQLAFYAGKLCLSERYLGTLIRQESGQTAKEWIDKAVLTDAQVLLMHTDKTVAQISDELNFANSSFFCKYFRRLTGMSPQEYRDKRD